MTHTFLKDLIDRVAEIHMDSNVNVKVRFSSYLFYTGSCDSLLHRDI